MIPKRIYYCWFGDDPNFQIKACIDSWHRVLPDYEIIKLGEADIDKSNLYYESHLRNKKYAYLSDLLRLQTLYDNAGIYLDTDIYMLKPFSDDMLSQELFMGATNSAEAACGVIGVANVHDELIKSNLNVYANYGNDDYYQTVNTTYMKKILREEYNFYRIKKDVVHTKHITIYPREYFYPLYWNAANTLELTPNTTAIHLWTGSANRNNPSRMSYKKHEKELRDWLIQYYPDVYERDFSKIIGIMISGKNSEQWNNKGE